MTTTFAPVANWNPPQKQDIIREGRGIPQKKGEPSVNSYEDMSVIPQSVKYSFVFRVFFGTILKISSRFRSPA
jgi:hypothetical protein